MNDKIQRAKAQLAHQKERSRHDQLTLHTDKVSFYHAYKMFWRQGRMMNDFTSRHNYWYLLTWQWLIKAALFIFAILFSGVGVMSSLDMSSGHQDIAFFGLMVIMFILLGGYILITFVPMMTLTMRRYKDVGLNRFLGMLMYLILGLLVVLYFFMSDAGQTVIPYLFLVFALGNLIICSLPHGQFNHFEHRQ